jgi:hypothetical protein
MSALHAALLALTEPVAGGGGGGGGPGPGPGDGGGVTPGPLDGVRVNYGPALPDPGRESLNILGLSGEQSFAGLGQLAKEEIYTVEVLILVIREGQQTQPAVERAYVLMGELENQLRETLTSPTMGNTVRVAAVESVSLEVGASDTTRSALLTIGVRVQARI